jgi:RNA polymerase primary sigma factor
MGTMLEGPGESRGTPSVASVCRRPDSDACAEPGSAGWIEAHRGTIAWVAREYRHLGVPMEDLAAEGVVGLLEAAARFDPGRGVKFASYASWWIRKRVCDTVMRQTALVRVPRYRLRHLARIRAAEREATAALGRPPSSEEIAEFAGVRTCEVEFLLSLATREISLGTVVSAESGLRLEETLAQQGLDAPGDALLREDRLALLDRLLARLPDREREIVSLRFGLDGARPRTLAEVGRRFGLSRERVRQVENRALAVLRKMLAEESLLESCSGRWFRPAAQA